MSSTVSLRFVPHPNYHLVTWLSKGVIYEHRIPYSSSSGRNTARATVGGEFPSRTLSIVRLVPKFPHGSRFRKPLLIPDSRISRVRLAAVATFPKEPSHIHPRLKHSPAYTPCRYGYNLNSTSRTSTTTSGSKSGSVLD